MRGERTLVVSAPGRLCLFGEHQDYLGLPVVAAAIDRRLTLRAGTTPAGRFRLALPDVGRTVELADRGVPLVYRERRDYFRSVYNTLLAEGLDWQEGWDGEVRSEIPINAGTSSSTALTVAWTRFLLAAAGDRRGESPEIVARLAHRAEVVEFGEPGGAMDHFACALGGVLLIDSLRESARPLTLADEPAAATLSGRLAGAAPSSGSPAPSGARSTPSPPASPAAPTDGAPELGTFVLGHSLEPKDTLGLLSRVKATALEAVARLRESWPGFDLAATPLGELEERLGTLPRELAGLLEANLIDRDLLRSGLTVLETRPLDHSRFGTLLDRHQAQLRRKGVSTPKIERMLAAALAAGALGGKLNGSGGGGCLFAYAPHRAEEVVEAMRRAGGEAWIVHVDEGVRIEPSSFTSRH